MQISKYQPLSMLFNMKNYTFNDTYARNHTPPLRLPLPREFTFILVNGWGCRSMKDSVIKDLEDVRPGDVVIINIGAHCHRGMSFARWREYIDLAAVELKRIKDRSGVTMAWRTSFVLKEHAFRNGQHTNPGDRYIKPAHFSTDLRRQMFDSYVEHALVPVGVHIWDVAGLASMGNYMKTDMLHIDGMTIWATNYDMMDAFACPAA